MLALALVLGTLVGAVLYAVEPSATAVPRPEAATPASASGDDAFDSRGGESAGREGRVDEREDGKREDERESRA